LAIYRVTFRTPDLKELAADVPDDKYILETALKAGLELPYSCLRGWCLTCAARVIKGSVNQEDSFRYYEVDRKAGFALICTGKPESDLMLETHARDAMRRERESHGLPYPKGDWGSAET
jgi:ferredoxin